MSQFSKTFLVISCKIPKFLQIFTKNFLQYSVDIIDIFQTFPQFFFFDNQFFAIFTKTDLKFWNIFRKIIVQNFEAIGTNFSKNCELISKKFSWKNFEENLIWKFGKSIRKLDENFERHEENNDQIFCK